MTISDPATGAGLWVHRELVSPTDGGRGAYLHGWVACFRVGEPPLLERFGPDPVTAADLHGAPSNDGGAFSALGLLHGSAGALDWELEFAEPEFPRPLYTFPAWAWERRILPAAQIVPIASARFSGTLRTRGSKLSLSPSARGAVAHIYGHGNAERWGWLHAELGDGDVCEIVSAVSGAPGLRRMRPLSFVQLRISGADWPRSSLAAAPLSSARLGLPDWSARAVFGRQRLSAEVTIPLERSVKVGYLDPDGRGATCTNSELADVEIVLERRRSRWEVERRWVLRASAHAEIGTRP